MQEELTDQTAVDRYFSVFRSAPADKNFLTVIGEDGRRAINWGEFRSMCYYLARQMRDRNVGSGDVVLIFFPHQRWLIAAFVAAQLIGAIPSFMPPVSPRQDPAMFAANHSKLIASLQPGLLCVDSLTAAALGVSNVPFLVLEELGSAVLSDVQEIYTPLAGVALLQHSSGTTGLKKGVMLSYRAIMAQLDSYADALRLDQTETVVTWLPVYHDMGLIAATLLPLVAGIPVVAMGAFDWMAQPWRLLEEMSVVSRPITWLPNFAFALLTRTARRAPANLKLDHVRAFISCSEPCKPAVMDQFVDSFSVFGVGQEQLHTCYAMAENVFAVSQSRFGRPVARWTPDAPADHQIGELLSCGACIEGVQLQVRDDKGKIQSAGTFGELYISGTSLFDGYYKQPELTARKIHDGWYATGDLGVVKHGEVFISGRRDDLIIVAGRSLYAHELEDEVSLMFGVKPGRVCAFGAVNEDSGTEDLIVIVELAQGAQGGPALERAVRERLSGLFLVASAKVVIVAADTLIKTTSGKISRAENRERFKRGALVSWGGQS